MTLTLEEFDKLSGDFVHSLDDDEKNDEWYCTEREHANQVMHDLRNFLFKEEIDREARRKQYLELKAEFEPYL